MMTYAPPGQPGWHHVNCRPADYWIDRLSGIGFEFDDRLSGQTRKNAEEGDFKRQGLVFVRKDD